MRRVRPVAGASSGLGRASFEAAVPADDIVVAPGLPSRTPTFENVSGAP
ncbi:hypothetical protein [Streptomyces sp. NPDC056160]